MASSPWDSRCRAARLSMRSRLALAAFSPAMSFENMGPACVTAHSARGDRHDLARCRHAREPIKRHRCGVTAHPERSYPFVAAQDGSGVGIRMAGLICDYQRQGVFPRCQRERDVETYENRLAGLEGGHALPEVARAHAEDHLVEAIEQVKTHVGLRHPRRRSDRHEQAHGLADPELERIGALLVQASGGNDLKTARPDSGMAFENGMRQ